MARRKNSLLGAIIVGPGLFIASTLVLWENEGRYDYYRAARDARVIAEPGQAEPEEAVALSGSLEQGIPIEGEYVGRFVSYHRVTRRAEIYSWYEDEDDDGSSTWRRGWYGSLDPNSRNRGLHQRLGDRTLYPPTYRLGTLEIVPERIHLVDGEVPIPVYPADLTEAAVRLGMEPEGEYLYLRKSAGELTIGDERVRYTGVPNAPRATYFGVVFDGAGVGKQFEANHGFISAIIMNDGILHHLVNGDREEALASVKQDFVRTKWIVRAGGTLGVVTGLAILFGAFASLLYRIPLLGRVAETGAFLLAVLLGLPFALLVIVSSLVVHTPWIVGLAVVLAGAAAFHFMRRSRAAGARAGSMLADRLAVRRSVPVGAAAPVGESDAGAIEQTFSHLAALGLAEGGLGRSEVKFLTRWGERNGLPGTRMRELLADARSGSGGMEAATREDLELLVCMAMVDGVLSAREWSVLKILAKRLEMSHDELQELVAGVETAPAPV